MSIGKALCEKMNELRIGYIRAGRIEPAQTLYEAAAMIEAQARELAELRKLVPRPCPPGYPDNTEPLI